MVYYLYVKTHNKTGLKYLGQTKKNNPIGYKGSGIRWTNHLKKHGYNVTTEIIGAFDILEDLAVAGKFWSKYWNVVESDEWANLMEEAGNSGFLGGHHSEDWKKELSKRLAGKPTGKSRPDLAEYNRQHKSQQMKGVRKSKTHCNNISQALKGKPKSESHKNKLQQIAIFRNSFRQRNERGQFI